MKITQIEQQKRDKTRVNIYVDYSFYCGLNMEAVVQNRLKIGQEIEKDFLDEIQVESEQQTALNKAVKYISKTMKTEKQIIDYLKGKGYVDRVVEFVLGKLKEYNFVDDEMFVNLYIKQSTSLKGKKRLQYELKNKGIDEKLVLEKVNEIETDRETALNLAEKFLSKKKNEKNIREKLFRFLSYRGFAVDDITYVLRMVKMEEEDDVDGRDWYYWNWKT